MNPVEGIRAFIEYVARGMSKHPNRVSIETLTEGDLTTFTISSDALDVFKIMGREGSGISAIRHLAEGAARQHGLQVKIVLLGEGNPKPRLFTSPKGRPAGKPPRR